MQTYLELPHSWPKERKGDWQGLSRSLREFLTKREDETHRAITELGTRAKDAIDQLAPHAAQHSKFAAVVEKHAKHEGAFGGLDPHDAFDHLLHAHHALTASPHAAIAHLMQASKVDPMDFVPEHIRGQMTGTVRGLRDTVEQLQQQLAHFRAGEHEREAQVKARHEMLQMELENAQGKVVALETHRKSEEEKRAAHAIAARKSAGVNVRSHVGSSAGPSITVAFVF